MQGKKWKLRHKVFSYGYLQNQWLKIFETSLPCLWNLFEMFQTDGDQTISVHANFQNFPNIFYKLYGHVYVHIRG